MPVCEYVFVVSVLVCYACGPRVSLCIHAYVCARVCVCVCVCVFACACSSLCVCQK